MSTVGTDAPRRPRGATLLIGALGVVFGDIGTSPLYAFRECLRHTGGVPSHDDLLGVLSLIVWALILVVTVKYLMFIMRADNKGEGGIFALLAIVPERVRKARSGLSWLSVLAVVGAALLYGDGVITPAISVLSAVEGLEIVAPGVKPLVVPITCGILAALFAVQHRGTGAVGKWFGAIMVVWFVTIAALGAYHVAVRPAVLLAVLPHYGIEYLVRHGLRGALILGSVVLVVTGSEALYADIGHFGVRPIRRGWLTLVMPALTLCYLGQGALLLESPWLAHAPFFSLVPTGSFAGPATLALVLLSSAATVIASQALISGVFSLTRQAMQLGYFPRVTIRHTAHHMEGQIYIPEMNTLLAAGCLILVIAFRESSRLAAAYGVAVTGTMAITSVVFFEVTRHTWGWRLGKAALVLAFFLALDIPFLVANLFKFLHGGWVPILIGAGFVAAMLVWKKGRALMFEQYAKRFPRFEDAMPWITDRLCARVPGTAVFLTSTATNVPHILMHHVDRNRVLHDNVVLLTVQTQNEPSVPEEGRTNVTHMESGFHRVVSRYGFMEQPNVVEILDKLRARGDLAFEPEDVTYYLGRENVLGGAHGHMGSYAERIFSFLTRNATRADRHFGIPPNQVVEIGTQIDL